MATVLGHGSALAQDADGDTAVEAESPSADEMHAAVLTEDRFPSASVCGQCHPRQYREWSVSPHAYGQLSPVVMAFQNVTTKKVTSTVGDFCQRCHAPISAALGQPAAMSNLDRPLVARESITCIACHRVNQDFGRITGRYPILEGDIHEPVYSVSDGERFMAVLNQPERYQLQPNRGEQGRTVHAAVKPFFELRRPNFCGAVCHEVTAQTGARSHEMLTEYKRSPAAAKGITCVDCHMGSVQGKPSPFEMGPAAVVGGVPTPERPLSNHFMAGPDYSIVHPGIFPHNVEAEQFKTPREWIAFDVEAGWGTDDFEDEVDDYPFPEVWESVDDRYDARAIIDEQFALLDWAAEQRLEVLRNGFGLSEVSDIGVSDGGIGFSLTVANLTEGHYVPTSFDIKRTVFLQITVTDSAGTVVYRSGDRDPNGDLRDSLSRYVVAGLLPHDDDLFNLQSKTYVAVVRGPERSQNLAPPMSLTTAPVVRPDPRPTLFYGRTRGSRKHRTGIPAEQSRTASYEVPAEHLHPGETYSIDARLIFQPVPINLIHESQPVGFDYGLSPKEVADRIVKDATEIWRRTATVHYAPATEG